MKFKIGDVVHVSEGSIERLSLAPKDFIGVIAFVSEFSRWPYYVLIRAQQAFDETEIRLATDAEILKWRLIS